jgi:ABC-type transport system involved in multi-copper enzyme maturation permease subunit
VIWVTWRQHRLEALWSLVLTGLLAASVGLVAYAVSLASPGCPLVSGLRYCLPGGILGKVAQGLAQFNLFQYGLVVLPALAGAFIGAPLVAREIENGTQRLAWTQGVTRSRWILTKLALVIAPLLVAATIVGMLEVLLLNVQGPLINRWDVFDQQAPLVVASTFFAMGLGVAFGAFIGRSVPAMAITLVTFVIVRIGIAELVRPHFMAPLRYATHNMATLGIQAKPTAWWLGLPDFYDSAGHLLSTGIGGTVLGRPAYAVQYFQPGDRFWTFQSIESAILTILALALLGLAAYWTTRRLN